MGLRRARATAAVIFESGDRGLFTELGLSGEDCQALARQGFLAADYCWKGGRRLGPYYKLRWRRDGRQCVRYVGGDPDRVERISAALENLQRPLHLARCLAQLMKEARRRLRSAKHVLAPCVANRGLRYHGYTARRPRTSTGPAAVRETVAQAESGFSSLPYIATKEGTS